MPSKTGIFANTYGAQIVRIARSLAVMAAPSRMTTFKFAIGHLDRGQDWEFPESSRGLSQKRTLISRYSCENAGQWEGGEMAGAEGAAPER